MPRSVVSESLGRYLLVLIRVAGIDGVLPAYAGGVGLPVTLSISQLMGACCSTETNHDSASQP